MTEQQWFKSNSIAELMSPIPNNNRKIRLFCCAIKQYSIEHEMVEWLTDTDIIAKLKKPKTHKHFLKNQPQIAIKDIFGDMFRTTSLCRCCYKWTEFICYSCDNVICPKCMANHAVAHVIPQTSVLDLAEVIYNEKQFDLMPQLGDALEEFEVDEMILNHCRQITPCPIQYGKGFHRSPLSIGWVCEICKGSEKFYPHWQGCWLLDQILGKSNYQHYCDSLYCLTQTPVVPTTDQG